MHASPRSKLTCGVIYHVRVGVVGTIFQAEQDSAKASGVESASLFTLVKGVIFSGAKV